MCEGPGSAILREPGPGLMGESGNTLTTEYTGTVMLPEDTGTLAFADLREPYAELVGADLCEEGIDLRVP